LLKYYLNVLLYRVFNRTNSAILKPSKQQIEQLIGKYLDGDLAPGEKAELEVAIRSSESVQDLVVAETLLHATLRDRGVWDWDDSQVAGRRSSRPSLWTVAALALTAVLAVVILLPSLLDSDPTTGGTPVARVIQPSGTSSSLLVRDAFFTSEGFSELEMEGGALLALADKAKIQLINPDRIRLISGDLGVNVPDQATGFTVETTSGEIVDFGTRFGVSVNPQGETQAHLFKGKIEVNTGDNSQTILGTAAVSFSKNSDIQHLESPANQNAFPMPRYEEHVRVVRGDFEPGSEFRVSTIIQPKGSNIWAGDACEIVGPTMGVSPYRGDGMLRLISASSNRLPSEQISCNVVQWIDLGEYVGPTGGLEGVRYEAQIFVNRVADTRTRGFGLRVCSCPRYPENTAEFRAIEQEAKEAVRITDDDPETWEKIELSGEFGPTTRVLLLDISAREQLDSNLQDGNVFEFGGHFVDAVEIKVMVPARPAQQTKE